MKSLKTMVDNFNVTPGHAAPTVKRAVPEQAMQIINQLFVDLKAIFPAWKHAIPTYTIENQAKIEWTKAFIESGISHTEQLKIGLKKARKYSEPWFPSCGQFIEWCKPSLEDYGLPSVERALRMVIDGKKREIPAVFAAAKATGSWALKNMTQKELLPVFTRNYEIACSRVINGEDLSIEIPKALPKSVFVKTAPTSQFFEMKKKLKQLKNNGEAA